MRVRCLLFWSICVALSACTDPASVVPSVDENVAPLHSAVAEIGEPPSGRYLVRFAENVQHPADVAHQMVLDNGGSIMHVYEYTIKGFYAKLPPSAVDAIRRNPTVVAVGEDKRIALPDGEQLSPPIHLDRLDQRTRALDGRYRYDQTGAGVNIYILGDGVQAGLPEFENRLHSAWTFNVLYPATAPCGDHETPIASLAAGKTYGVAKQAEIWAVRFAECDPVMPDAWPGDIIAAVDWVAGHYQAPAVANLSWHLDGTFDAFWLGSLADAVKSAIERGIPFVVSAGNKNPPESACDNSPGSVTTAIVVGAIDQNDTRLVDSNYGYCVDLFAPGVVGAVGRSGAVGSYFGTSFSTPLVTGTAALILQEYPSFPPASVEWLLQQSASQGVTNAGAGSPDRILYSRHLYAYINGPTYIDYDGNFTWEARAYGGSTTAYVYNWSVRFDDGTSYSLGSGRYAYMQVKSVSRNFRLTLDVAYPSGDHYTNSTYVYVCSDGDCYD